MALKLNNIGGMFGKVLGEVVTGKAQANLMTSATKTATKELPKLKALSDKKQKEDEEKKRLQLEKNKKMLDEIIKKKQENQTKGIKPVDDMKLFTLKSNPKDVPNISPQNYDKVVSPVSDFLTQSNKNKNEVVKQIPLATLSAVNPFVKSIAKASQESAKEREKTLNNKGNSIQDIFKKSLQTPLPSPMQLYGNLLNEKGYKPEQQGNYNKAFLDTLASLPKETLKGIPLKEQLQNANNRATTLTPNEQTAVGIGENVVNPVITMPSLPLTALNLAAQGYSSNDPKQAKKNMVNIFGDITTQMALGKFSKLGTFTKGAIGGATGSIASDVSVGDDVNLANAGLQAGLGGTINKGFEGLASRVKLPQLNPKTTEAIPQVGMSLKRVDDNGLPTSAPYSAPKSDFVKTNKIVEPTSGERATSKLKTNTLPKAEGLQDEAIQNYIKEMDLTHEVKTNKATIETAMNRVESDLAGEIKKALNMSRNDYTSGAEDITSARFVADKLGAEAVKVDTPEAWGGLGKVIEATAGKGLDMGQAIQAFKNWQASTPTGVLYKAQKLVDSAKKGIIDKNPKMAKSIDEKATKIKEVIDNHKNQTIDTVVDGLDDVIYKVVKQRKETPKLPKLGEQQPKEVNPKEYIPEEELAKKIISHTKEPKLKEVDENVLLKDMVNTLYKVAKETPLPDKLKLEIANKTPIQFIGEAINNKSRYLDVYTKAKETVKSQLGDNKEALTMLDDYFNRIINKGYSQEQLNKAVSGGLKDFNTSIKELVKTAYQSGNFGQRELTRELIKKAGVKGEEATQLGFDIHTRLKQLSQEYLDNQIGSIIGERVKPKLANPLTKIEEYGNMGLFRNELYSEPAEKLLGTQISNIIKQKGINIGDIAKQGLTAQGEARKQLVFELSNKLSLNEKDVNKIVDTATNIFNSKIDAKQRSLLAQMTKEYVKPQQKSTIDKIKDFYNLGAFDKADLIPIINEKMGMPSLTADDYKYIYQKADEINILQGRQKEVAIGKLENYIGDKLPPNLWQQARFFPRMMALTAPSTGMINNVSNYLRMGARNVEQPLSALVDLGVSKITKERKTPFLPSFKEQGRGIEEGHKRQFLDFKDGVDTSKYDNTHNDMFRDVNRVGYTYKIPFKEKSDNLAIKGLQTGANAVAKGLRKTEDYTRFLTRDDAGYEAAFNQRTDELKRLNPNAKKEDIELEAKLYAEDETFKGKSWTSSALQTIGNIPVVGDGLLPFARTMGNIISKGTDYIPEIGTAKAVYHLAEVLTNKATKGAVGKEFNQKYFTDLVARIGIGGVMVTLGAEAARQGMVTEPVEKNEKQRKEKEARGEIPNSIKVGDEYFNLGKFGSWSMPFLLGANKYYRAKESGEKYQDYSFLTGVFDAVDSVFDSSLGSGINKFASDYSNKGLSQAVVNTSGNLGSMATTPGIIRRTTLSTDPYKRETYSPDGTEQYFNSIKQSNPLTSQEILPKRDVWGEKISRTGGKETNLFESLFSPFTTSKENLDDTKIEVKRLFDQTGKTEILPKVVEKKVTVQGISIPLSAQEYNDFQKLNGKLLKARYDEVIARSEYQNATDEEKFDMLEDTQRDTNKEVLTHIKKQALDRIETEKPDVYNAIVEKFNKKK